MHRNEVGQEDIEEITKSMMNDVMTKTAHKEELGDYFEQIDTTETNRQKINTKVKEHKEEHGWRLSGGFKASAGEGRGSIIFKTNKIWRLLILFYFYNVKYDYF